MNRVCASSVMARHPPAPAKRVCVAPLAESVVTTANVAAPPSPPLATNTPGARAAPAANRRSLASRRRDSRAPASVHSW